MNNKLLHKTQRAQLLYLLILFVLVAPIFYIVVHKLYVKEVDESLILAKSEFLQKTISKLATEDIANWNRFNEKVKIEAYNGIKSDTLYNKFYYNFLEKEEEPFRVLESTIIIDGKIHTFSLRTSLLELEDLIIAIIIFFIIILLLLITGVLFINQRLSKHLWRPFYKTLHQIERFEIDKNNKPDFSLSNIEEFNRLNESIEKLIIRNIQIYNNQREFVENAAHELQTPIAVFKAKIDMLIQRDDITHGQAEILTTLNETTSRLNKLNRNLLLLSKIDNQQFSQKELISINELIKNQLPFFEGQAIKNNIEIKAVLNKKVETKAHIGLTEIMVNNLLLNAIKHNVNNGIITISTNNNSLTISNTGKSEQLQQDKLFSRFYKSSTSNKGNGLGLAIVKKIVDQNQWTISYSYFEHTHTFTVHF